MRAGSRVSAIVATRSAVAPPISRLMSLLPRRDLPRASSGTRRSVELRSSESTARIGAFAAANAASAVVTNRNVNTCQSGRSEKFTGR